MLLVAYSALIIILMVISRKSGIRTRPRHAAYVRIIIPAVSMVIDRLRKGSSGNISHGFRVLYGRLKITRGMVRETDIKIASLVLFMGIPAAILTFLRPGKVEIIVCTAALVMGYMLPEIDLRQKAAGIMDSVMRDFPVFCMDLAMFSGTGTGLEQAWSMALKGKPESVFYQEAARVRSRTHTGMPFEKSLIIFARRFGIPEIYSFSTLIGQSLKTGSSDVVSVLREHAMHSWEGRLARAREKGDKASVKMIFPLVMGLTGIILILAYPAFAVMKGMI